jgi:phosphotriesterase-related protein
MAQVETMQGPVDVDDLGPTLMHEHVFVLNTEHLENYGEGAWWDEEQQVADAIEKLRRLGDKGVKTIVDPTVIGLGRYIPRLQRIAPEVPVQIVVATGMYTYGDLPFVYAQRGPGAPLGGDEPMVADFVRDITEGIAGTGVKAAFLKCAVEHPDLSPGVERALRAVAVTHKETGVPITVHTNPGAQTGTKVVEILREEGADLTKVVLGHSGDSNDLDHLKSLADTGAILGMDRFGIDIYNTTDDRVSTIVALAADGYADRMVLSHDASCYIDWFGPDFMQLHETLTPNWHYEHISDDVLPALLDRGVTQAQIDQMMVDNPKRYFAG